jgi:cell division protein FtsQ
MWDNPRLLNMLAGFLVGLTGLAFALAGLQLAMRSPLWPVHDVTVQGSLEHTTRAEIEQALRGRVSGNFFSVDVGEVRNALEQLPWVRRGGCAVWPDRLEATSRARCAGRWGERSLVNTFGRRFTARARRSCRASPARRTAKAKSPAATHDSIRSWRRSARGSRK